jgi:signal transduction histidine kinase
VHLILSSEPNTAKSIFILGDETRLRQVLLILLDNALKHTSTNGKIEIKAERDGRNIRIIIEDNGHGIPTEHLEHIFERFYQAPGNHSDENQGSGLGLSIAKSLVESQGGNIWLESQVEKGTRVTITLPVFTSPA